MRVTVVSGDDELTLQAVLELARVSAKTLGFLPAGAFRERAAHGQLLAAHNPTGALAGYLLFRVTGHHASIVHLCVRPESRKQGVARALVRELRHQARHLRGISLRCRTDYPAHELWPALGFKEVAHRRGRSRAGWILAQWWLDLGHPDLFALPTGSPAAGIRVALDMNIVLDLEQSASDEEVQSLRADWIGEDVAWCVTPEARVEADRDSDATRRAQLLAVLRRYEVLPVGSALDECEHAVRQLLFPDRAARDLDRNDLSDVRHLAYTAAAGIPFFLTKDADLLKTCQSLEVSHGVSVLRPADFVTGLDRLLEGARYRPALLRDRAIEVQQPPRPTRSVLRDWIDTARGERKSDLTRRVCRLAARPREAELTILVEAGREHAIVGLDRSAADVLSVQILRAKPSPIAATLARHLLAMLA